MCRKLSLPARGLHKNTHTALRHQQGSRIFMFPFCYLLKQHTKQEKKSISSVFCVPKGWTLGMLSLLSCKPTGHTFISDCLAKVNTGITCKALPGFRVIQSFCCSRTERMINSPCETFPVGLPCPRAVCGRGCYRCPVHPHSSPTNQQTILSLSLCNNLSWLQNLGRERSPGCKEKKARMRKMFTDSKG